MNLESLNGFINKKELYLLFLVVCLFLLSSVIYINTIVLEPSYIHVWAQTDRYALALGFLNNGFDFFHPQTYTLDLQFPAAHELQIKEGITRVDFPIHEYIIALLMKLFGTTSPLIFRLYILLYSWVGLIFLALLVEKLSGSRMKGLFVMVFAFTAPVFTYYQAGFLPTIPSIADAMIAFYFYYQYKTNNQTKNFYISLLFFTLSALSRTPFAILLIAFSCQQILEWICNKKINGKELVGFCLSYAIIGGYFSYNIYLGNTYGSIFLSHPLPASSFEQFKSIFTYSWSRWRFEYFTKYHYAALLALLLLMVVTSYKRIGDYKPIIVFTGILLIGEVLYGILMVQQFVDHDYYFLDTFYLLFILLLVIIISPINVNGYMKYAFVLLLLTAMVSFSFKTNRIQKERYTFIEGDMSEVTRRNFEESKQFLDSLMIPQGATLLVLGSYSYNIPFVKMNRKGVAVLYMTKENIVKAFNEKFDYIIVQNQLLLSNIISSYPEIVNEIEKVASNGKITIYKRAANTSQTVESFVGLKSEDKLKEYRMDYDNYSDSIHWLNIQKSRDFAYSGNYSSKLTPENEFGLTLTDTLASLNANNRIFIRCNLLSKLPIKDASLVVSVSNSQGIYFYTSQSLNFNRKENQWKKQYYEVRLPNEIKEGDILQVYFYNSGRATFYYDDMEVSFYKLP